MHTFSPAEPNVKRVTLSAFLSGQEHGRSNSTELYSRDATWQRHQHQPKQQQQQQLAADASLYLRSGLGRALCTTPAKHDTFTQSRRLLAPTRLLGTLLLVRTHALSNPHVQNRGQGDETNAHKHSRRKRAT